MRPSKRERGMVLVNVLLMVALAAGILALMAVAQETGLDRTTRLRDAAAADAALVGGELSAIAALRRDGVAAPDVDTLAEPWAQIGDASVAIAGGRFQLVIEDAQSRLNLTGLVQRDMATTQAFAALAASIGAPSGFVVQALQLLQTGAPIDSIERLRLAGLDPATLAKLAPYCTILPVPTAINVNTVPEALLAVLIGDPVAARVLASRRARQGALTRDDFALAHAILPAGVGFASDHYWVHARVTIHGLTRERTSLLRRDKAAKPVRVAAVGRWIGPVAVPLGAPPLPDVMGRR